MSENNGHRDTIDIPRPPLDPSKQGYYFIYGEWKTVTKQTSTIATPDNPNPQTGAYINTIGLNEVTDMPPLVFAIMAQTSRPGYVIKWSMSIPKELYLWHQKVNEMMSAAVAQKRSGPKNG